MEIELSFLLHLFAVLLASIAFLRLLNQFKLGEPCISSFFIRILGSLILSLSASHVGVPNPSDSAYPTAQDQAVNTVKSSAGLNKQDFVSDEGF